MEIIKTTALITINETLWVQMAVFLLFLLLIDRIMFRRVRRNLKEREAHFDAMRQDIAALKQEISDLTKETEAEENRLKATAHRIADNLREESRAEARQMIQTALDEIKERRQSAEKALRASAASARQQIDVTSEELTQRIIGRLVHMEKIA